MAKHDKPKRSKARKVLLVFEIIFALIAAGALVLIGVQVSRYYVADQDFKEIVDQSGRKIAKLKKENPECVGWIRVKDTRIDYPVMYSPDDPEFYLHRNFKKKDSFAGTPFMGDGSEPDNPASNSQIIYAHHMNDGSMFGQLEKFNDKKFAQKHVLRYTDINGTTKYRVFAAFYVDLSRPGYYSYWNNVGVLDQDAYEKFVDEVMSRTLYTTKYKAEYGKKILMLSTCSYGTSEQRFVVFGVEK